MAASGQGVRRPRPEQRVAGGGGGGAVRRPAGAGSASGWEVTFIARPARPSSHLAAPAGPAAPFPALPGPTLRPPPSEHRSPLARGLPVGAREGPRRAGEGRPPPPAEGGAARGGGAREQRHGASPARPGAQPRGPRALSGRGLCAGGSGPGAAARPMERPRAGPPAGGRAAAGGGRRALRRRLR